MPWIWLTSRIGRISLLTWLLTSFTASADDDLEFSPRVKDFGEVRPATYLASTLPTATQQPPQVASELSELNSQVQSLREAEQRRKASDAAKPLVRWSAELQMDTYASTQTAANNVAVGDIPGGAAFRRARIAMLGDYSITEYRLEVDFAQLGRPSFLDVWGAVNELPILGQVKAGNFFEPFGLERLTSNRFAPLMERNLPDQPFDPQRNPGIQAMNQWDDDHGTWALGYFGSHSDLFADSTSFKSTSALTGRITWMPYYDEPSGGRYYTHLGVAGSLRHTVDDTVAFRAQPEARLGAAIPNIPFFVDTGTLQARSYELWGVEFAQSVGSWWVQSEMFLVPVDRLNGPNVFFSGWYAQTGYFFTGEHRPFRRQTATFDRVQPFEEFFRVRSGRGVMSGKGAWEGVLRVSGLDLSDKDVQGGNLVDLTVGVNWYLNPFMRVTSNYVHAFLRSPVNGRSDADLFGTRVQYEF